MLPLQSEKMFHAVAGRSNRQPTRPRDMPLSSSPDPDWHSSLSSESSSVSEPADPEPEKGMPKSDSSHGSPSRAHDGLGPRSHQDLDLTSVPIRYSPGLVSAKIFPVMKAFTMRTGRWVSSFVPVACRAHICATLIGVPWTNLWTCQRFALMV